MSAPAFCRFAALALALLLAAGLAGAAQAAHHEPVLMVVTVDVQPGQFESYRGEVKKLVAIQKRLGSTGQVRMWRAAVAGPASGDVIVAVEYPNAEAWAADQQKLQGDAEYTRLIAGLDSMRSIESTAVWRDITPLERSAAAGGTLVITGLEVKPGKLDAYLQRVKGAQKLIDRVGPEGRARMWHADIAGANTGAVVFGVEYPSLAAYLADQNKVMGNAEYRKFIAGLDDLRSVGSRSIFQEVPL